MLKRNRIFASVLLIGLAAFSVAAPLTIGSPAPAMDIKTWIKGKEVKSFEKGKTYVVEFWATWCGPCRTSIPHITELAKKNKDVTFIGVGIWEDNDDKRVEKFVEEMGDKMDYTVAYSGNKEGMSVSWMQAAGRNGIPSAFIVKDQMIVWMGHPMSLDAPLGEIKAGTYDMAKAAAAAKAEQEATAKAAAIQKEFAACEKMYDEGKTVEAKAKLDQLVKDNPNRARNADGIKIKWKALEDPKAFLEEAKSVAKDAAKRDPFVSFGMSGAANPKTQAIALQVMDAMNEATDQKDVLMLYYAAVANQRAKKMDICVAYCEKALAVYDASEFKDNADLKKVIQELVAKAKG